MTELTYTESMRRELRNVDRQLGLLALAGEQTDQVLEARRDSLVRRIEREESPTFVIGLPVASV